MLTQNPQLSHSPVQTKEHPERARVIHTHLHAHVGTIVAEDDLPFLVDQETQDVAALQGSGHSAHRPKLLPVHQSLRIVRQVAGAEYCRVTRSHAIRQRARPGWTGLGHFDEDGLPGVQGPVGEHKGALFSRVLGSRHRLLVERFDVGAAQLVEMEVALQGGRQQRGLLGVEGVLRDGARRGGRGRSQVEGVAVGLSVDGPSVILRQVEITQADRQTGVVGFVPQRGGAQRGERARTEAVGRNGLAVCKGERIGMETGKNSRQCPFYWTLL